MRFLLVTRVQCRTFLDNDGRGLAAAPGGDLILRMRLTQRFALNVSLFAERLYADAPHADDGYFVRCMAGTVFPGNIGEVSVFASVDAGNGIGLLVNRKDIRFSGGLRYAPFAHRTE